MTLDRRGDTALTGVGTNNRPSDDPRQLYWSLVTSAGISPQR